MAYTIKEQAYTLIERLSFPYIEYFYSYIEELCNHKSGIHWLSLLYQILTHEEKRLLDALRVIVSKNSAWGILC